MFGQSSGSIVTLCEVVLRTGFMFRAVNTGGSPAAAKSNVERQSNVELQSNVERQNGLAVLQGQYGVQLKKRLRDAGGCRRDPFV